ncbi:sporulation protein [Peribacillus saganii]|uniref:Sporulation protein n=2 Tax=Peribacillus saganii TaxID=2303992 RepID=A0A372LPF4_9BACI|nr:sporulation protein [Peribacillus saganii]
MAKFSICIALLFALGGCSEQSKSKSTETRLSLLRTTNPHPAVLDEKEEEFKFAEKLQKEVLKQPEIYDVAIIMGKKEVLVAYKVRHLQRFRMKKIEKNLTKKLEKQYPKEKFIVSSDYKIFIEAVDLNEKLKDPKYSRKKATDQFKSIIKLQKEQT